MRPSEALKLHKNAILEVLARFPVKNPRVFGSVLKGTDTEESDIDIIVERTGTLTYFDIFDLETELKKVAGVDFDVRLEGEFSDRVKRYIDFKAIN